MASLSALRGRLAATRRSLRPDLLDAYARFYDEHGATHALTISLGIHPKIFDPETEFFPQIRRVTREIAHRLRGVPKRQLLRLRPDQAVWMAGFYEATDAAGQIFPHWHGVISLRGGEEDILRDLLVECVGDDMTPGAPPSPWGTTRPVITTPRAKPTFDLQSLYSSQRYVAYANKKVRRDDATHWTVGDFLRD